MKEKNKKNLLSWLNLKKAVFVLLTGLFLMPSFIQDPPVVKADSVIPNMQDGTWDRSLVTAGNDQLIGLTYSLRTLLWTAGIVLESSQSILTRVADTTFYQDQLGGFYRKRETGASQNSNGSGWVIMKNICNTILIILLLFVAFGTILRVESYNYKYLLVKLIVVALLVNFSGVIAGIVLDFNHIIMGVFSDQIANIGKSIEENSKILKEFTGTTDLSDINAVTSSLGENITRTVSRVNVNLILASILMFILGITVLAVALFLIVRTVSLWLLFTLSPLALALYVLPHTRVASLKWWDAFLRYAFAGPLLFFFLYLTVFITRNMNIPAESTMSSVNSESFIMFSNSGSFLDYLFLVILLWASIFLSRSLSIAGSTQVVGYFKDITRGEKGMRVITKLVDTGGAALEKSKYGKVLHQWTGAPLQVKGELQGPFRTDQMKPGARGARAFQPVLKTQTEATKKALESMLNPSAIGRVISIVDAKRKGGKLSEIGGDLQGMSSVAALSAADPSEFLRTLWRRFEPKAAPSGSFWRDAKAVNEEINRQIDTQEGVRRTFNELGIRGDKITNFQAKDQSEREAQIYKLAWTGALPDYFNQQGKAYNPQNLATYLKTNFGDAEGSRIAEKLKMIGEAKNDTSLSVAAWNEKKDKFEINAAAAPQEAAKIKPEDLRTMTPQSLLVKNEKGQYAGFNDTGKQFLQQMSPAFLKEIKNMRQDTVKAIAEAYKTSQKSAGREFATQLKQVDRKDGGAAAQVDTIKAIGKEFAKQLDRRKVGTIQTETIKTVGRAQMHGPFHVEEVQAPHSQISLGQEFLNKVASRAFAGKKVDTGGVNIISGENRIRKEPPKKQSAGAPAGTKEEPVANGVSQEEQAKISGRAFAEKQTGVEKTGTVAEPEKEENKISGLGDKQKYLMLGERRPKAEAE